MHISPLNLRRRMRSMTSVSVSSEKKKNRLIKQIHHLSVGLAPKSHPHPHPHILSSLARLSAAASTFSVLPSPQPITSPFSAPRSLGLSATRRRLPASSTPKTPAAVSLPLFIYSTYLQQLRPGVLQS